jgi:hypothetical protein
MSHGGTTPVAPVRYVKLWVVAQSFVLFHRFCGKVSCPDRIFSSVRQLEDMMVSHADASDNRDASRLTRGER